MLGQAVNVVSDYLLIHTLCFPDLLLQNILVRFHTDVSLTQFLLEVAFFISQLHYYGLITHACLFDLNGEPVQFRFSIVG